MRWQMLVNGALLGAPLYFLASKLIVLHWPTVWQIGMASAVCGLFGFTCPKIMRAIVSTISYLHPW